LSAYITACTILSKTTQNANRNAWGVGTKYLIYLKSATDLFGDIGLWELYCSFGRTQGNRFVACRLLGLSQRLRLHTSIATVFGRDTMSYLICDCQNRGSNDTAHMGEISTSLRHALLCFWCVHWTLI